MTEQDGFRIEAAEQFGFMPTEPDAERYECTKAQLIAFAKACERKGVQDAISVVNLRLHFGDHPAEVREELESLLLTLTGIESLGFVP